MHRSFRVALSQKADFAPPIIWRGVVLYDLCRAHTYGVSVPSGCLFRFVYGKILCPKGKDAKAAHNSTLIQLSFFCSAGIMIDIQFFQRKR